jgi:hypothetical protein
MQPNQTIPLHFMDEQVDIAVQMKFILLLLRTLLSDILHCTPELVFNCCQHHGSYIANFMEPRPSLQASSVQQLKNLTAFCGT